MIQAVTGRQWFKNMKKPIVFYRDKSESNTFCAYDLGDEYQIGISLKDGTRGRMFRLFDRYHLITFPEGREPEHDDFDLHEMWHACSYINNLDTAYAFDSLKELYTWTGEKL